MLFKNTKCAVNFDASQYSKPCLGISASWFFPSRSQSKELNLQRKFQLFNSRFGSHHQIFDCWNYQKRPISEIHLGFRTHFSEVPQIGFFHQDSPSEISSIGWGNSTKSCYLSCVRHNPAFSESLENPVSNHSSRQAN